MIPPEVPTFSFHTALFVPFAGCAELRYKPPMRSERDEPYCFLALVAAQNAFHSRLQIVVSHALEHTAKPRERPLCASRNACCVACRYAQ